jgi:hypothetical protein
MPPKKKNAPLLGYKRKEGRSLSAAATVLFAEAAAAQQTKRTARTK